MDTLLPAHLSLGIVLVFLCAVYFFHTTKVYLRLRRIPGPFLTGWTDGWLLYKYWTGVPFGAVSSDLHEKYGPVVRVGPNRVWFGDTDAIDTIFRTTDPFKKSDSYDVLLALVDGRLVGSMIALRDEQRVTALKKHIASTFTTNALLAYETKIDDAVKVLINELAVSGPIVNIAPWMGWFTFDALSQVAFSEDQNFMIQRQDVGNALEGSRERFHHWHYWGFIPRLEQLLFKNCFRVGAQPFLLLSLAVQKVKGRKEKGDLETQTKNDLLEKYLSASRAAPEVISPSDVIGLVISTLHAGADTTATTLTLLLRNLCQNPHVIARLREELKAADLSDPRKFQELNKLEYFQSVIKESMRFTPTTGGGMERIVPEGGAEIAGTWIPGGTAVTVSQLVTCRDPKICGDGPDRYDPDRWLRANESQRQTLEKTLVGTFGGGKRVCLGQHLAWIEMTKALTALVVNYDISLVDPHKELRTSNYFVRSIENLEV